MSNHFSEVFEWRMKAQAAIRTVGRRFARDVAELVKRNRAIPRIGLHQGDRRGLLARRVAAHARGRFRKHYLAQAQLTALDLRYFEDMGQGGKDSRQESPGTLSIHRASLRVIGQEHKAEATFAERVQGQTTASPDANAASRGSRNRARYYKNAPRILVARRGDRGESEASGTRQVTNPPQHGQILAVEEQCLGACNKLAVTRSEHRASAARRWKEQWLDLRTRFASKPAAAQ